MRNFDKYNLNFRENAGKELIMAAKRKTPGIKNALMDNSFVTEFGKQFVGTLVGSMTKKGMFEEGVANKIAETLRGALGTQGAIQGMHGIVAGLNTGIGALGQTAGLSGRMIEILKEGADEFGDAIRQAELSDNFTRQDASRAMNASVAKTMARIEQELTFEDSWNCLYPQEQGEISQLITEFRLISPAHGLLFDGWREHLRRPNRIRALKHIPVDLWASHMRQLIGIKKPQRTIPQRITEFLGTNDVRRDLDTIRTHVDAFTHQTNARRPAQHQQIDDMEALFRR